MITIYFKAIHSMQTFLEELLTLDLTDFITTLIQQGILTRDKIHFAREDNSGVEYWYLMDNGYIDTPEIFLDYNISYIDFGNEIFIGIGCDYDQLIKDPDWIKFYKEYIE